MDLPSVPPARARRTPVLAATMIQALALAPTLGTVSLLSSWQQPLSLYEIALLQGVLAALLTWMRGLDPWWRAIQLVFPVALVGADALHVPAAALLSAFVFLVLLFWSTFRTQVPFFPSGPAVWRAVAELLPADRPVRLIDIGSGLGGLVLELAHRRPASHLCGIEVAPLPWLLSVLRARFTASSARFVRGDYERLDFADFDVVFAYLSPAAMPNLWQKAVREMRPATMLVSYEFSIVARAPDKTVPTAPSRPPLFVWFF